MRTFITGTLSLTLFLSTAVTVKAEESGSAYFTFIGNMTSTDVNNDLYAYQGDTYARVTAWKNDTVYLKLAAENLSGTTAQLTQLQDAYGNTIEDVSIGVIESSNATWGYGTTEAPTFDAYDIVTNEKTLSNDNGYYLLTIKTGNCESGKYSGSIVLGSTVLNYDVVVSTYDLNDAQKPSLNLWQYPFSSYYYYDVLEDSEPFSEKHLEILRDELSFYKEIGGTSITATISEEPWEHQTYYDTPSMVTWHQKEDGTFWFDYTYFDAWVELCTEEGIDEWIDCFSILPFDNSITLYLDADNTTSRQFLTPGDETWNYYWTTFLWDFADHLDQKGWFTKVRMFIDEKNITYLSYVQELFDLVTDSQGNHFKIASAVNTTPQDSELFDQVEYLSVSVGVVDAADEDLMAFLVHRNELGLETTLYNCSTTYPNAFVISDPYESVWTMWYMQSLGMNGFLRWAYNAWNEDPLTSMAYPDFEAGDAWLIYPDEQDAQNPTSHTSIRLCMIAQGINEIAKYNYLLNEINDSEVTTVMNSVVGSIERSEGTTNAYGAAQYKNDSTRKRIESETLRMESMLSDLTLIASVQKQGGDYTALLNKYK